MDVATIQTISRSQGFPMSSNTSRARPRTLALCLVASSSCLCCCHAGSGLVALDLGVRAQTATGAPLAETQIWLLDHDLPRSSDAEKRRHLVCTTDSTGRCTGSVSYWYEIKHSPWQKDEGSPTSATRFEIAAELEGQLKSMGFLPPLKSHQVHGLEQIQFTGQVENLAAAKGQGR